MIGNITNLNNVGTMKQSIHQYDHTYHSQPPHKQNFQTNFDNINQRESYSRPKNSTHYSDASPNFLKPR